MRVRRAAVWLFARELDGKAWNPAFRWTERRAPLVILETDSGAHGIGEAWTPRNRVESVLDVLVNETLPALVGKNVEHPKGFCRELQRQVVSTKDERSRAAGLSAADMALWDAFARDSQQPLWRVLGGTNEDARVYASGGLYRDDYSLDELQGEARGYRNRGFDAMKMKVAGIPRPEDLRRVAAVRDGLGDDARLWVDAVNQLTVESAKTLWSDLAPYVPTAMQSPLPPDDVAGLIELNRDVLPVIFSEAEHRPSEFKRLLEADAVTYLQYCLTLCGGFSGGCVLDDWALSAGVMSTPQCFSTSVAQAATLHFAAARPNVDSAEFHCFHDHLAHLYISRTAQVESGRAYAGDSPGLGVAIPNLGLQPDGSLIAEVARFG